MWSFKAASKAMEQTKPTVALLEDVEPEDKAGIEFMRTVPSLAGLSSCGWWRRMMRTGFGWFTWCLSYSLLETCARLLVAAVLVCEIVTDNLH